MGTLRQILFLILLARPVFEAPELFVPVLIATLLLLGGYRLYQRRRRPAIPATPATPAEATGIQFIESGEPLPSDSRCLICRHALAADVIYCVRCHTPHHRECFRYVGSCSVYACRNRAA